MYTPAIPEPPRWLQDIRSLAGDANHLGATYISSSHIQRDYLLHVLGAIDDAASSYVFQAEADKAATAMWSAECNRLTVANNELYARVRDLTDKLGEEQRALEHAGEAVAAAHADAASLRSNVESLVKANAHLADDIEKFTANIRELELDLGEVQDVLAQDTQLHENIVVGLRGELNLYRALDIIEGAKISLRVGAKGSPGQAHRRVAAVHDVRNWQPETVEVDLGADLGDDTGCACGEGAGCSACSGLGDE